MAAYDYLLLDLQPGLAARREFVEGLSRADLPAAGLKPLALFTSQLGWDGSQVALLLERTDGRPGVQSAALGALASAPQVRGCEAHVLEPTVRPTPNSVLKPGGIYVHRWFEVRPDDIAEFVALSAEAWPDFEGRFDAQIFGLFRAGTDRADKARLLLITRYANHGVWEDSRDPTTSAMQTFARRALLTLQTRAASSLLVPL
ncbi:MAG: hypothetical protein ACHP84_12565 [Caulobacterales bacterium]